MNNTNNTLSQDLILQYRTLINSPNLKQIAKQSKFLLSHKQFMTQLITVQGMALQYASQEIRDDNDIVKLAVYHNEQSFHYASARLKNEKSFLLELFLRHPSIFKMIDTKLQHDKAFVLDAVNVNPSIIKRVKDELKCDIEVLKIVLEKQPSLFSSFSKNMKKMIGKNDPLDYINKLHLQRTLEDNLDNTTNTVKRNKI